MINNMILVPFITPVDNTFDRNQGGIQLLMGMQAEKGVGGCTEI